MEKYKVLVVEDVESAREQMAKAIRKEGFEVVTAENGRSGLEIIEKESPEIVITDLRMPEIDGLELMHRAKSISPNVQIILITAFGETDTAIMALREGVLDYLKKPLDLNVLTLALGRAKEKIDAYRKAASFPTLLLAEDEDKTRLSLSRVLAKENWKVIPAANGREAMDIFRETKIDIILLDIKMPEKDGIQTLHEMRALSDDFEAIILTAYGDESNAIQAMRDGAMNFIKKPIDLEGLVIAVEKAIEKLNSVRALKYRTRELELSQELIARITAEKKIIIDLREYARKAGLDFARKLLDSMPLGLLVVDGKMNILYMNAYLASGLEGRPERIDEEFVGSLKKFGIKQLSCETVTAAIDGLFDSPPGKVECIRTDEEECLTLTAFTLLDETEEKEGVLMAVQGRRGQG